MLLGLPRPDSDPRASIVAFVVQVALIAVIVPSLIMPLAFDLFLYDRGMVTPERISFITALPAATEPTREVPRAGGDGRVPSDAPVVAPPVVAPRRIPTTVPPSVGPARADPLGVGPLVGGGGPTRGIRPSFTDRRLWLPESEIIMAPGAPKTRADTLRQLLAERTTLFLDSMARIPGVRRPGDWTFERNGKKYGIDRQFIRLGDFSIPTALLAALPMNVQANPIALERALRLDAMRGEIMEQAARVARDDEFRAAVRALRERKERERREAEEKKAAETRDP